MSTSKSFENPWASRPHDTISDSIILCAWREEARAYQNDDVQSFFNEYDYAGFLDRYEGSEPWNKEGYGLRTFDQIYRFHWFFMKRESPFTSSKALEKVSWVGLYKKGLFKIPFTNEITGEILKETQKKNIYYRLIETRIAYLTRNKIIERNNKGTYKLHLDSLTLDDWALIHGLSLLPPNKTYRLPSIGNLISLETHNR